MASHGVFGYTLRPYQQEAVDATWGYLVERQGNPVIIAPTGAGKSLIIADLARGAFEHGRRVLVLAHRKELLQQNAEKMRSLIPDANITIYSAGLGKKDPDGDIVVAGIQSIHKNMFDLGTIDLVLIDEAHMIPSSGDGMYRNALEDLSKSSPAHRVVGLTATPYRMTTGLIYGEDELFDGVSYNIEVGRLIKDGFLCPITSQAVKQVRTDNLPIIRGEFSQSEMSKRFDDHTVEACEELVALADDTGRKHVIVFSAGVENANHIAECIEELTGEIVHVITGETLPIIRESSIDAFRSGSIRWLVNVDVLTTGFDAPCVDCVAVLRATESAGLFCQIIGRGLRLHPEKIECIVADFGGNLERHGPIDSPDYGIRVNKSGEKTMGNAPVKECPNCSEVVPAGLRTCFCGFTFPPPDQRHDTVADTESPVLVEQIKPQRWLVDEVRAAVHSKRNATEGTPRTLRIDYCCQPADDQAFDDEGGNLKDKWISEWVCLEHEGFAGKKAYDWWNQRSNVAPPDNIEDAVLLFNVGALAETTQLITTKDGKFTKILRHTFGEKPDGDFSIDSGDLFNEFDEEEAPF